jgi:hypothetical protein
MEHRPPANLLEALLASLEAALRSPEGVAPPVAVVWTDADGQWRPLIPALRAALPQFYTLGPYDPAARTGPVIWLKCIVDRTLPEVSPPEGVTAILYLADVDRQHLRAAGECPELLQPLVELQYRGAVWHQRGGRDWSVEAFLTSEHGLGLDVALNAATREAILRALPLLATEPLAGLRGRRLEAEDFDRLSIGDPVRDVLLWMSDPEAFRARCDAARWQTFRTVCMREFDLDPDQGGTEAAGQLLLHGGGKWDAVWQRFREAPRAYRGISALLRSPVKDLFVAEERWPTVNADKEDALREELEALTALPHHDACERLLDLENEHRERRGWVWAELGESPLALALEPLARLARLARSPLGGATLPATIEAYVSDGWRCDRAALEAIAGSTSSGEGHLVSGVVRALYEPWLDKSACHFQTLAGPNGVELRKLAAGAGAERETCLLFADGLRFDVARLLHERLEARGVRARLSHRVAPFPTVTATAKPLACPASGAFRGEPTAENFTPVLSASGLPVTVQRLRDELAGTGVAVLGPDDARPPANAEHGGWSEIGQLDRLGHSLGARLTQQVETEVEAIAERVLALLEAGWSRVKVVTDHGWLLLPGGLPKVELPHYLVATRWTRCAAVRGESAVRVPEYAWHWNPHVRIASPPGVGSFLGGTEYSHGGVSVQECVVPELVVERGAERVRAEVQRVQWRGMRCRVTVATNAPNLRADIRLNWKQPGTSIVAAIKEVGAGGEASLAVADDTHEGAAAAVVVLDANGKVLDHQATTVGEGG